MGAVGQVSVNHENVIWKREIISKRMQILSCSKNYPLQNFFLK